MCVCVSVFDITQTKGSIVVGQSPRRSCIFVWGFCLGGVPFVQALPFQFALVNSMEGSRVIIKEAEDLKIWKQIKSEFILGQVISELFGSLFDEVVVISLPPFCVSFFPK